MPLRVYRTGDPRPKLDQSKIDRMMRIALAADPQKLSKGLPIKCMPDGRVIVWGTREQLQALDRVITALQEAKATRH